MENQLHFWLRAHDNFLNIYTFAWSHLSKYLKYLSDSDSRCSFSTKYINDNYSVVYYNNFSLFQCSWFKVGKTTERIQRSHFFCKRSNFYRWWAQHIECKLRRHSQIVEHKEYWVCQYIQVIGWHKWHWYNRKQCARSSKKYWTFCSL